MHTIHEAETWAREHAAMLRVNYAEGIASLQVSGFVAYSNTGKSFEEVLPQLIAKVEQQMNERLTQPQPISNDDRTRVP